MDSYRSILENCDQPTDMVTICMGSQDHIKRSYSLRFDKAYYGWASSRFPAINEDRKSIGVTKKNTVSLADIDISDLERRGSASSLDRE